MEECKTKRETFYHDLPEGELIYESDALTTVEREEGKLIIKVYATKDVNWMQLADFLRSEALMICHWGHQLRRQHVKEWADIPTIERNAVFDQNRIDKQFGDDNPYLYMYFYDDKNWVMYESDDEYLFRYELHTHDYDLSRDDMDALSFNPHDEVCYMTSFLRRWYGRVNGYPDGEVD